MKRVALAATFSLILLTGCNKSRLFSKHSQIDFVPQTFENPTTIPDRPVDLPLTIPETDSTPTGKSKSDDKTEQIPEKPKEPSGPTTQHKGTSTTKPDVPKTSDTKKPNTPIATDPAKKPNVPEVSQFIKNAEIVMINEGKKIGTPCNFYLSRVLEISGFSKAPFLANDFDDYAKKYFSHFRVVNFVNDFWGSDKARLKQHIWSYPERTPFVMQWSRTGFYGHLAIVERIGDQLIVYQASLNSHTARRDQTTVDILLNGLNRRTLAVYTEFTK